MCSCEGTSAKSAGLMCPSLFCHLQDGPDTTIVQLPPPPTRLGLHSDTLPLCWHDRTTVHILLCRLVKMAKDGHPEKARDNTLARDLSCVGLLARR